MPPSSLPTEQQHKRIFSTNPYHARKSNVVAADKSNLLCAGSTDPKKRRRIAMAKSIPGETKAQWRFGVNLKSETISGDTSE
jgi:hypothetical protein